MSKPFLFCRYVLQLAIADEIFLLTVPFQASSHLRQGWLYSNGLCKTVEAIVFFNYYASVFFFMVREKTALIFVKVKLSFYLNEFDKTSFVNRVLIFSLNS